MSPVRMSRVESGIRVVLEFNEAFNRHDVPGMMQLMSDDCVFENTNPAPDGAVFSGKASVTQFWQDFFHDSPQAHIEVEDIFGFGMRCICAGDTSGWTQQANRAMSAGLIYSKSRTVRSPKSCPMSRDSVASE